MDRYRRQIIVKEFGESSQDAISKKNVLLVGGGGLGSNVSDILVRMGIGSIDIVDFDSLNITNIHRTSIFDEDDVGKNKSKILEEKLSKINQDVKIKSICEKISKENISALAKNADIIVDATDNMQTRYLINDYSIKNKIPWVYGGVHSTTGMVMGIFSKKTPCLKCLNNYFIDANKELPVLGNLPVSIASIQCTEALKIILGKKTSGLIIYDIWKQDFEKLDIKKNPNCSCCSKFKFEHLD